MKSRVVAFPSFLAPEVFPYASVEIVRAAPVTTKLHLTAREMTAVSQMLGHGWTLRHALESLQCQRALLASLATHAAPTPAASPIVCAWCPNVEGTVPPRAASHGICPRCVATFEQGAATEEEAEADDRDEDPGSNCRSGCGYCGRCS